MDEDELREYLDSIMRYPFPEMETHELFQTQTGQNQPVAYLTFRSLVPGQPDNPHVAKEIGPEGGMVELENVARLEIPAGALDKPTLIKIYQMLRVQSNKERPAISSLDPFGRIEPGEDFITPVVRLEPFGMTLNVAAKLYLPTDAARVGINDLRYIQYRGSLSAANQEWYFDAFLEPLGTPEAPVEKDIQGAAAAWHVQRGVAGF